MLPSFVFSSCGFVGGLLIGLACIGLSGCGTTRNETATAQPAAPAAAATPKLDENRVTLSAEAIKRGQIESAEVATQSFAQSIEAPGRLAFNEDAAARVGTIVSGRVTKIFATVGDTVSKGQSLVYLHSHELVDARAAAAKAAVIVADKERALTFAKSEAERTERLLAAKAIAQREVAQAQANIKAVEAELAHAQAEKERADEFLEHLSVPHDSHDDIVISSPISGTVIKRDVSVGTVVTEASDLIHIADTSTLWAIAAVPEPQAATLRVGQSVALKLAAFPNARFSGRVVYLGNELDPATRTVQVRCLVQNVGRRLRPEMTATIVLNAGGAQSIVAVPRDAVQELEGAQVVFLTRDGGTFEKVAVETGREQNGQIEIISGLSSGQRVVTRGAFFIKTEFQKAALSDE
ncbi:MAG: efflux RND transporter periplasmic adaptor subunit [Acidobacteria bacterium]|nr:efflux RND transporter periplasmic adaptor subunit [Acidobacteriota bacterium]